MTRGSEAVIGAGIWWPGDGTFWRAPNNETLLVCHSDAKIDGLLIVHLLATTEGRTTGAVEWINRSWLEACAAREPGYTPLVCVLEADDRIKTLATEVLLKGLQPQAGTTTTHDDCRLARRVLHQRISRLPPADPEAVWMRVHWPAQMMGPWSLRLAALERNGQALELKVFLYAEHRLTSLVGHVLQVRSRRDMADVLIVFFAGDELARKAAKQCERGELEVWAWGSWANGMVRVVGIDLLPSDVDPKK